MTKIRVFVFLLTIIIVGLVGIFASYYARGYRVDWKTLKFQPNGILVIQSEPTGASVFIDGELRTATNATLSLSPGTYDVEVRRDGFFTWYKRLVIQKEVVTSAEVSLFRNVPSLAPVTFSGAVNPVASDDQTKIAFSVLPANGDSSKVGLYVLDTFTLPLGFSTEPKRITDGDMTGASYLFSPDTRQLLLTTSQGIFLLDTGSFTSQSKMVNITAKKDATIASWKTERDTKNKSLIQSLPSQLTDILQNKTTDYIFSPDASLILYTASSSGNLADNLIPQLPGASTQKQERTVQTGHTYIYDIKEDRNFFVTDQAESSNFALRFMPDSHHLLLAENGQVQIMDYDGTNRQVIYSGSYVTPNAFPYSNATKLLILTNLGASNPSANLYTLTVK